MVDYQREYAEYWSRPDRWGYHSFADPEPIVDQILVTCGGGKILDVGCGMGLLVRSLLSRGLDAHGIDIASAPVAEANRFAANRFRVGSLTNLEYPNEEFDTVVSTDCLEHLAAEDIPFALAEMYRVTKRFAFIRLSTQPDRDQKWHLTVQDRRWWENMFFRHGFRKHPLVQAIIPFESLENERENITLLFEKIPLETARRFPLEALDDERDLHMDMLRESGRRSDAHIARYMLAKEFVRRNDVVLDAACGLGYGSAILLDGSQAHKVMGVDNSPYAIDYARANFTHHRSCLEFDQHDVCDCSTINDYSIDLVVSFETLEHLLQPEIFLEEACRILKPGGRLICSVPNRWVNNQGIDPNPYHYHVFDFERLKKLVGKFFIVEQLFAQSAGGGMVLTDARREMKEIPSLAPLGTEAEWWIMVGMKSPVSEVAYTETVYFPADEGSSNHPHKYATSYRFPWIQHSLVTRGLRARTRAVLQCLIDQFEIVSKPGSTEQGAILCVQAYQLLENDPTLESVRIMRERIRSYVESAGSSPMHIRWKISCSYALAQLELAGGEVAEANASLRRCVSYDFMEYTPALATKTVHAWIQLGKLSFLDGDLRRAEEDFREALAQAFRAIHSPDLDWKVDERIPGVEIILEGSDVLNLAAEAAVALRGLYGNTLSTKNLIPLSERHTRLGAMKTLKQAVKWEHGKYSEAVDAVKYWQSIAGERETYCLDLKKHLEYSQEYARSLEQRVRDLERGKQ